MIRDLGSREWQRWEDKATGAREWRRWLVEEMKLKPLAAAHLYCYNYTTLLHGNALCCILQFVYVLHFSSYMVICTVHNAQEIFVAQHRALSSVHPNAWFFSALSLRARHCWSRRSVCLRRWYLNRHRFTNSEPHTSLCSNQKEGSQFKSTDCVHKTWWSISNLWIVIINLFEHLSLGGICVLAQRPIYCFA